MLSTKYIILFWIITLVLFTFYCIFRLWYMSPYNKNNFYNIIGIGGNQQSATTSYNAISYANDILAQDKIQDIPTCSQIYDDNLGVRALGYRDCNSAFSDYITRNLDSNNKYGFSKSLNEYCPETTKSPLYVQCMGNLLNKFNTNANIFQGINTDMTDSINKRLQDRSDIINDIQLSIAPYVANKDIIDFKLQTGAGLLDNKNQNANDSLNQINNYYQSKYGISKSIFANTPILSNDTIIEGFQTDANADLGITVDPYIIRTFFGNYKPVKGQYLAFDNISIILDFAIPEITTTTTPMTTRPATSTRQALATRSTRSTGKISSIYNNGILQLTITDNNTNSNIVYQISDIDNYQAKKNVVIMTISNQTVNNNSSGNIQNLQQLLVALGITTPTKIIMSIEIDRNDAGLEYRNYKLMNIAMDTIMVLKRIK
jgi:hypothetical protein